MEDLITGKTKSALSEVAARLDAVKPETAENKLTDIIANISLDELMLVKLDIEKLISKFLPKRKKRLTEILESRFAQVENKLLGENHHNQRGNALNDLFEDIENRIEVLARNYIFQWGTYYKDFISYVFNNFLAIMSNNEIEDDQLERITELFSQHAKDISDRGYNYSLDHGISDELALFKTTSGMQQFLYLIINTQLDRYSRIDNAKTYKSIKRISSKLIHGIINGYALTLGWNLLYQNFRHWVAALGFMRGQDAAELLAGFKAENLSSIFENVVPTLLASDRLLYECNTNEFFMPRLSRVSLSAPFYLDINYITNKSGLPRDVWVMCIIDGAIKDYRLYSQLKHVDERIIITKLENFNDEMGLFEKTLNSNNVSRDIESANLFSDSVFEKINLEIDNASNSSTLKRRENYASKFPLDDPDFRKLFIVDRNSVNALLEGIQSETGIHLWCSARRSGKTTAAEQLVRTSDKSIVIFQTMDSGTKYKERSIFENSLRGLFSKNEFIEDDYFKQLVHKCAIASTQSDPTGKKITFILDEYESLFGILDGIAKKDQLFKFQIVQPLLSQMVAFSTENMIIFMGQKPDAYYILPAQNQLSPLVKQHSFPLFEHHSNATNTEFSKFLKQVLTEKLPFSTGFCDAVYGETSGHPYLTVNVMVDFCDWLSNTDFYTKTETLDESIFEAFVKGRLTTAQLSKSSSYYFFQTMLNQYLSENGKNEDYWLYLVAKILNIIATRHPKVMSCSMVDYVANAKQVGLSTMIEANQFLSKATMSNFLKNDGGTVKPGIRIMARLAACAIPGGI